LSVDQFEFVLIIIPFIVDRCGHIESGRPTELDKAKLLQTLQPVHASLSAEDGQRFREEMRPKPSRRDTLIQQ